MEVAVVGEPHARRVAVEEPHALVEVEGVEEPHA